MEFLVKELTGKRPLMPADLPMSPVVSDVLNTFRVLGELPPDSLGAQSARSCGLAAKSCRPECGLWAWFYSTPS